MGFVWEASVLRMTGVQRVCAFWFLYMRVWFPVLGFFLLPCFFYLLVKNKKALISWCLKPRKI